MLIGEEEFYIMADALTKKHKYIVTDTLAQKTQFKTNNTSASYDANLNCILNGTGVYGCDE